MEISGEKSWRDPPPDQTGGAAGDRGDLIKRLFAVAISIGFGNAVAGSNWVKYGRMPSAEEGHQIAIVLVAVIATILSWDGYLTSIRNKPLKSLWRFAIDVVLVFSYMFIFITSKHSQFWLPIISFMFILYILWDIKSILEFPDQYADKYVSVADVYYNGLKGSAKYNAGPVITAWWALLFFISTYLYLLQNTDLYVTCFLAVVSLYVYRLDKRYSSADGRRGFTFSARFLTIVAICFIEFSSSLVKPCLPWN